MKSKIKNEDFNHVNDKIKIILVNPDAFKIHSYLLSIFECDIPENARILSTHITYHENNTATAVVNFTKSGKEDYRIIIAKEGGHEN